MHFIAIAESVHAAFVSSMHEMAALCTHGYAGPAHDADTGDMH